MYEGMHVTYPLFLSILTKLELSRQISEKYSKSNLMKIHPVGAELYHADGKMDKKDEANSRISQLWERAKKQVQNW